MVKPIRRLAIAVLICGLSLPVAIPAALGLDDSRSGFTSNGDPAATLTDLFRKLPYLIFPGDPSRMEVLWQLTATSPATIAWGPDTTCGLGSDVTAEYGTDFQHSYVIQDLAPGTHYDYKVTAGDTSYRGSFTTAPDSTAENVKFFVYGDTRSSPLSHEQVAAAMQANFTADPTWQTFTLMVGDFVNNGASETDWTNQFFAPAYTHIRGLMAGLPYQACIGNHEGAGALFTKYFPYPYVAARYWSFDYGPAHIAVMDQYTSYTPGSAQLQWLANDLAQTTKEWKFILLHEPGWSAGGGHENNTAVQNYIQPLCEQYKVSIVFGGHNHYYARAIFNNVQHITTGGGGAPLYTPNLTYPFVVRGTSAYHHCEVEIAGQTLSFRAVKPDGTVIDSFSRSATGAPEPAVQPRLGGAHPNPFRWETVIDWSPAGNQGAQLVIVDASGRVVRSFAAHAPGNQSVTWDGRDAAGRGVASGIYFARLEAGGRTQITKLVLAR
jgi:hypothetical protein